MPKKDCILDLPGFSIQRVISGNPLIIEVNYRRKAQCPYCHTRKLRKKASFMRHVRHESFGHRRTVLRFKAYKFYCAACFRYFNQRFPGIGKHQRASERLHNQVFYQHSQGISQKDLAVNLKLGKATIERWYHKGFTLKNQQLQNRDCPQVLGIDEHSFSKKQGYATTLCDLAKHKVFDVVKGRSKLELKDYLDQLKGKERVKVVCMDLSSSYRHLIRQYFPQAKIVADRFHVIRQLLQSCIQTYQAIDPQMKHQRGLLAALRTYPDNLSSKRLQVRNSYFNQQPAIKAIYDFKQQLYLLLMKKTLKAKHCKRYLPIFLKMIQALKLSPFKHLKTLGKTFYQWREEIVRMWRFSKSNGITEGFHRKMKLIQRRAYGFRNFENYRLRVKVLCS